VPDRPPRRAKARPTSKLRGTHQLHLCRAPALIVLRMPRSAIGAFTRVFHHYSGVVRCGFGGHRAWRLNGSRRCGAAKGAAPRPGHAGPCWVRRRSPDAAQRAALCGVARCWSGGHRAWRPGAAEQREARCTASGTREEIAFGAASDLPVGRFLDRAVQPSLQKYFASVVGRNIFMSLAIPSHTEGRFAIVTDVGAGCGGRGSVWRAMGSQGRSKDL
jgi:hypothetical protein